MNETALAVLDRVAILGAATLMLLVMWIERNKHRELPASAQPPDAGTRLLRNINVPEQRPADVLLIDVAFLNVEQVTASNRGHPQ